MTRVRTTRGGVERPLVVYGANAVLELLRSGSPLDRLCLGPGPRETELAAAARAAAGCRLPERAGARRRAGSAQPGGRPAHGARARRGRSRPAARSERR